jgi:hypothetical protein
LPIQECLSHDEPEQWGRYQAVFQRYGIKRGTLYNLTAEGRVKSVVLRRKGNRHGCRLWLFSSISAYLHSLLSEQNATNAESACGGNTHEAVQQFSLDAMASGKAQLKNAPDHQTVVR